MRTTGRTREAELTYRRAETLLVDLAPTIAGAAPARVVLSNCRSGLGWLLHMTGRDDEALAVFRLARADQEALAGAARATAESRRDLASTINRVANLLAASGMSSESEAEYRTALAIQQKLVDDNPAVPDFRNSLADSHLYLGILLSNMVEVRSAIPSGRDELANCQINSADLLRRSGRLDEALAACERSLAVREPLVRAHPEFPVYRARLGETYLRLGQVRCEMKNLAGAAADWKRACAHYDANKSPGGSQTFFLACCHAGLAGLAGRPGSGISAAERAEQGEKAMAVLCQAVTMGYRNPEAYRTESALDSLRNRPDFRALMMDLVFPTNPFAQ
jgi:eukaryotic-like serine/threonine-protein kinase